MKLGIVISTNRTSFTALSYSKDIGAVLKSVASMGYDGAELAVRNPDDVSVPDLKNLLRKYKLEVPAIGTGQAFLDEGLSLSETKQQMRKNAVNRIKKHVRFAAEFNAGVIIGLIRGRGNPSNPDENRKSLEIFSESLKECADFAREQEVKIFIEPINRYETALVNTVGEGMALIDKLGYENIKLLIDTFHMNIEEASIYGSIVKATRLTGHVHFADSNRHSPGSGHLEFSNIVDVLSSTGYDGYISMEMLPYPTREKAAEMSMDFLKNIMI